MTIFTACGLGACESFAGHPGSCAVASGWESVLIAPDCRDGKHGSCTGGWNVDRDMPDTCPCTCHTPETETTP